MIIDISPVLDERIAVWPGDAPFARTATAAGSSIVSEIRTSVHAGAHADAPGHVVPGGEDIARRSLDFYVGPCVVLHVPGARGRRIVPRDIRGRELAPRVLLRTGSFPDPRAWNDDFAALSPELVDALHADGVITVGIDTPSVDPFHDQALEAHRALVRNDMASLEGLVLKHVSEGRYELIALPLRIAGADGSPVRAVLRTV